MKISEMSSQECRDLLARMGFGRLACSYREQPYIVPIYFTSSDKRLYAFATMGQKIEWMRSNPLVCLEVDDVQSRYQWESVVVQGRYEELPNTPEYAKSREQAQALLEKRSMWWQTGLAAAKTRRHFKEQVPVFFSIDISQATGLRASPDPAPAYIG